MSSESRADEIVEKNEKTLSETFIDNAVKAIDNSSTSNDTIRALLLGTGSSVFASTIKNARNDTTVLNAHQITNNIHMVNGTKDDKQQQQQDDEPDGLTVEQRNRLMLKAGTKAFLLAVTDRLSK